MVSEAAGSLLDPSGVTFQLPDRAHRLSGVRVLQNAGMIGDLDLEWRRGQWQLTVTAPDVDRIEYLFEIVLDGRRETITDPGNPHRVDGAFGQKSVIWLPSYEEPSWLRSSAVPASSTQFEIADVDGVLWVPESLSAAEPAPLIVVHDGPEYAELADFTCYIAALIGDRRLPPTRVALLAPGDRNARYAANGEYAAALCDHVVPTLRKTATAVVGVGASLGALALLHAHCQYPDAFDALLLQSGSFFTPALDPQESGFSGFAAVTRFVATVDRCAARPVPTVMTCGTVEENLANNRRMRDVLTALGYPVDFAVVRDAHNYTAWRDALDPHLTNLLSDVVSAGSAKGALDEIPPDRVVARHRG